MNRNHPLILEAINLAITEDIGDGDHSSLGAITTGTKGRARLLVKERGILCGLDVAAMILDRIDPTLRMETLLEEGDLMNPGDIAFTLEGDIRSILQAERIILNFMQRMSGIATLTKRLVDVISETNCIILDTRKTTPGLRVFEKWAVKTGGGQNHRFGLYDMVMLKDNHIDYAGGISAAVKQTVQYLKSVNKSLLIEVETRNLEEVEESLTTGEVHRIMFDNFSPAMMREAVKLVAGKVQTEASGGITERNIREYAETGVDFISVGALTHSVKSIDLSLKEY